MNNFKSINWGKGELTDTYPSAAYDALRKRKLSLRKDLQEKAGSVKDVKGAFNMPNPKGGVKPKKIGA